MREKTVNGQEIADRMRRKHPSPQCTLACNSKHFFYLTVVGTVGIESGVQHLAVCKFCHFLPTFSNTGMLHATFSLYIYIYIENERMVERN